MDYRSYFSVPLGYHNNNSNNAHSNYNGGPNINSNNPIQTENQQRSIELVAGCAYASCGHDMHALSNADQAHELVQGPLCDTLLSSSRQYHYTTSAPTCLSHTSRSRPSAASTIAMTMTAITTVVAPVSSSPAASSFSSSFSSPQQHPNSQQHLVVMNETVNPMRTLADDNSPTTSALSSAYGASPSLFYSVTHQSNPEHILSTGRRHYSSCQEMPHMALSKVSSLDAFSNDMQSPPLNPNSIPSNHSPGTLMTILPSQHHNHHNHNHNQDYHQQQYCNTLHITKPHAAHYQHSSYDTCFGPSGVSSSLPRSILSGGATASPTMNSRMHVKAARGSPGTRKQDHHFQSPTAIPLTISGSMVSTPPPFFLSSSSASPSLSLPSPLSLSSASPSSTSLMGLTYADYNGSSSSNNTRLGSNKQLSIMTNDSSSTFPTFAAGVLSAAPTSSSSTYTIDRPPLYHPSDNMDSNVHRVFSNNTRINKSHATDGVHSSSSDTRSSGSSSSGVCKKQKARYACPILNCHRTFSRPFNLKSHGLTHEIYRPHACDQCPKTFSRIHDRDRHVRGHISGKAYSCVVCSGRFARQDAVTRHLKLANEQNPCALILKSCGVCFREAAAGRVNRSALGEESTIRRTLEGLEEQARKARASRNLEMGMLSMNVKLA